MPTPPLPSRDDDEHGAMPADCRVETLHFWLDGIDNGACAYHDLACAVRALVEAKVREAVAAADAHTSFESVDSLVAFVLGGAS